MATNDFLVFGGGGGANVITQVSYSGLAARTAGFSSGVAQSAQLNKVWRQSSIMAAVLAQFISDRTGADVLDDGTTATILANLKASAAAVNGDATKTFSVAASSAAAHAARQGQIFGVNATYSTPGRSIGTTYTNSTGRPIAVYVYGVTSSPNGYVAMSINGAQVIVTSQPTNASGVGFMAIIPPGATYSVSVQTVTLTTWNEFS